MTSVPPAQGPPPQLGDVFGHYRLDSVIGVGGMGMVYSASDLRLGRRVAVKVVLGHYAESSEFLARFQREAAVLARLDSPHVISIYDHGEHDGWPYIATQYAGGGDLGRLIRERGAMPAALAARLCEQVADGLVAAHAVGVVHRDVKPANVLLRDERLDRLHVYLCDFGVAHTEATGLTTPGAVAGTWNYLAPERAAGEHGSPASDLYSVGCLFWEALTGQPPYDGSDVDVAMAHLQAPVPQLPGHDEFTVQANEVLARTMAKDPAARYASAAELREELRRLGGGLTSTSGTGLSAGDGATSRGRTRAVLGVVGALAVVGVVVTALLVTGGDDPAPPPGGDPTTGAGAAAGTSGDVDGDGFGDFATLTTDGSDLYFSSGTDFGKGKERLVGLPDPAISADLDGDGALETLRYAGAPPTVGLTVISPDADPRTLLVQTPPASELSFQVMAGDVDGDGRDDVVVGTVDGGELSLSAALSTPEGTLARSETWYTGTGVPESPESFAIGDFDDDGLADLVRISSDDRTTLQMLRSTGTAFEPVGREQTLEGLDEFLFGVFRAGDVDADGTDELVYVDEVARVFEWEDDLFTGEAWGAPSDGVPPREALLSDVSGDGADDLVMVMEGGVEVLVAGDRSFEADPAWSVPLDPDIFYSVLDPVYWDS